MTPTTGGRGSWRRCWPAQGTGWAWAPYSVTAEASADVSDLAAALQAATPVDATRPKRPHPHGWEPGVTIEADGTGTATVMVDGDDLAGVEPLLKAMLPDVTDLSVLRVTQVRAWDSGEKICRYVRCDVQATAVTLPDYDFDKMLEAARKAKAKEPKPATGDPLVVCLSDWQAGKADGDGVEGLIDRLGRLEESLASEVKRDRPSAVYLLTLGDLVEGCDGNYPAQAFSVKLDRRAQVRLVRRALWRIIERISALVPRVIVAGVAGNHGEHRKDGKSYTTPADNDDVAVLEQCAEIAAANPERYGHVSFMVPDDRLTLTLDIAGTIVGLSHGHMAKAGGGDPAQKIARWWERMGHQRRPIGDADILVTGHYHHLVLKQDGARTWMQCPALDGGSQWWEEAGGASTVAGTLTFRIGADGWDKMRIIR